MAIVKKYRSVVKSVINPLSDIYTVTFASLEKEYKFKPGQFLHLALDEYNPSMPWPESRCFSMQSSPGEIAIRITFAVKGTFTRRIAEVLKKGKEVYLKLPYGDLFTATHQKDKCVFIAGGTGITPYLSLFTDSSFREYDTPTLYLGVREKKYNFYNAELDNSAANNPGFMIKVIDESVEGKLDIAKIFSRHGSESVYFISGPPLMIKTFKEFLISSGVKGHMVRTDDWE